MRHVDGKIATNQVKLGDLDERVQGLVHEIQDTRQEVEDGKPLDAERLIAFEGIIVAVENATQTRQGEMTRLALELEHARKLQQEANERQSHHEVVSAQLHANIMGRGETSANRANVLEQEVIKLRAQYAADIVTPQRVVNGHAETQERVTKELSAQMTIIMQKLASFQPTPTTTTPAPLPTQVPAAPQVAKNPDRVQQWAQERQEQNAREQGRQDKGKQREGEPPRSGNQGGGNQGPPPPPQYNNPNPSNDGSDQGGGGGGGGGNPGWQPDSGDPIDPQVVMKAQAIEIAIANSGKRQADAPLPFKNRKDQNVKLWLLQCEDYFKRNPNEWSSDQDRITYALGRMEEEDMSAFAFTYRNKMTGELGHLKIEGYEFWETFRGQCILRFALTHEGERSLALMTKVSYKGNIDRYLLEMENPNTHASVGMSGVAWRQMIERHIPKDAVRRLSTEEYATESAWITALRTVCRREEIFIEQLALKHGGPSGPRNDSGGKRKREEKAVTKPKKQKKEYSAEEKAAYKIKMEAERKGKGPAPTQGKVEHTDWNKVHEGIKDQVVQDQKRAQQCTRCGLNNHKWANCGQTIQVSTIGTQPRKQFGQRPQHPTSRQWKAGPITPF